MPDKPTAEKIEQARRLQAQRIAEFADRNLINIDRCLNTDDYDAEEIFAGNLTWGDWANAIRAEMDRRGIPRMNQETKEGEKDGKSACTTD